MRQTGGSTFGSARAAVAATFATHAFISGSLGPWIPRLKRNSQLDPAGLGLALTGFAVGLVIGTRLASPALRRFGGRRVVRIGIPALASGLALLAFARGLGWLLAAFVYFGVASGLLDVAMNTEAVAVERRDERRLISAMHGTWSVSVFAGAALGSGGIAAGVPIDVHFPTLAVVFAAASFPLLRRLPSPHERYEQGAAARPTRTSAVGPVVLLCVIAATSFLTEGIAADWSAVYLRDSVGTGAGIAGLGVVAFSAAMAASRFAGDRLSVRFDPAPIVRVGAATGAAALGAALVVGGTIATIAGLAILGLSLGPVVPLTFRSAGSIGMARGHTALSIVVTSGYVGSIVGPLIVGFVADRVGLRAGFVVPVVACAAAAIAAGAIRDGRS